MLEGEALSYLHRPAEGETSPLVGRELTPEPGFFPWSTWVVRPALQISGYVPTPLEEVAPPEEAAKSTEPGHLACAALGTWSISRDLDGELPPTCRSSLEEPGKDAPEKLLGMRQIQEGDPLPHLPNPVWTTQGVLQRAARYNTGRPVQILRGKYLYLHIIFCLSEIQIELGVLSFYLLTL